MSANESYLLGDSLPWPVPVGITGGQLLLMASGTAGVAETAGVLRENGSTQATVRIVGVFAIPAPSLTLTIGAPVYATTTPVSGQATAATLSTTNTNPKVGTVYKITGSGASQVAYVNLNR